MNVVHTSIVSVPRIIRGNIHGPDQRRREARDLGQRQREARGPDLLQSLIQLLKKL